MINELEARRLRARAHDQVQRDAEAAAERVRNEPPPQPELPSRERQESSPEDILARTLVKRDGELINAAELRALHAHFEQRLDDLEALVDGDADA